MFCRLPRVTNPICIFERLLVNQSHLVTMFAPIFLCFIAHFISTTALCDQQIYKLAGTLNVVGLFNIRNGENCSSTNYSAQETAQNLITSVKAVRSIKIAEDIDVGVTIFDLCSPDGRLNSSCLSPNSGLILQGYSDENLKGFAFPVVQIQKTSSSKLYIKLISKVIFQLKFSPLDYLIVEDSQIKNDLIRELGNLHLCISNIINFSQIDQIKNGGNVVIIGEYSKIKSISKNFFETNVLIVPTDGVYDDVEDLKANKLIILMPTREKIDEDLIFDDLTNSTREDLISDMIVSKTPLSLIQMVSDIVKVIKAAKTRTFDVCKSMTLCRELEESSFPKVHSSQLETLEQLPYQLKYLGIDADIFAVLLDGKTLVKIGDVKVVKTSGYDWVIEIAEETKDEVKICGRNMNCTDCVNYKIIVGSIEATPRMLTLKNEAWVAALLSVSAVGLISCIAIAVFIVVRMCKKDTLEGNPFFSFLMLLCLILVYVSIIPYTVEADPNLESVLCGLKIMGTSVSYSLVFSIMLARSVMLASCDDDGGFMSHVNGYLQTILCFFIAAVQIALTLQLWAFNWFFSEDQCQTMNRGPIFLYLLGYNMFLLILLMCVSPFIMRSKRNYEEGGYFASSALLCLLVWISWASGYFFLPEYADIFVVSGLVATATVILVVVFIPRTYLMMNGIVRDHIVSTLPVLTHPSSVVDVNYRSTQALYDTVSARGVNPNYYSDRPNTPSTSKMDDRGDNSYSRYQSSPSPLPVTRF